MKQSPHSGAFRAPSSLPRDLCAGIAPLVPASTELTPASIPSSMLCPPLGMSFPLSTYLHPTHIFIHLFILPLIQKHLLSVSLVPEPRNRNLRMRKGLYVFTFLISLLSLLPNPPQIKKDRTTPGEPGPRGTGNSLAVGRLGEGDHRVVPGSRACCTTAGHGRPGGPVSTVCSPGPGAGAKKGSDAPLPAAQQGRPGWPSGGT